MGSSQLCVGSAARNARTWLGSSKVVNPTIIHIGNCPLPWSKISDAGTGRPPRGRFQAWTWWPWQRRDDGRDGREVWARPPWISFFPVPSQSGRQSTPGVGRFFDARDGEVVGTGVASWTPSSTSRIQGANSKRDCTEKTAGWRYHWRHIAKGKPDSDRQKATGRADASGPWTHRQARVAEQGCLASGTRTAHHRLALSQS